MMAACRNGREGGGTASTAARLLVQTQMPGFQPGQEVRMARTVSGKRSTLSGELRKQKQAAGSKGGNALSGSSKSGSSRAHKPASSPSSRASKRRNASK
jgi:hypothetical protein